MKSCVCRRLLVPGVVLFAISIAQHAYAQAYPKRPIRFIVPTSAGGGNDIQARVIGQKLTEALGQQVVVDNRPGASGIIGTELGVRAAPDGYTLLMGNTGTIATAKALFRHLPYDPAKDLAPVLQISAMPFLLLVHPSIPVKTVRELITLAKSKPGQVNYGSSGTGQTPNLAAELFKSMAGIDLVHIPYKGSGPAIIALLANQVQVMFTTPLSVLGHIRSGRLRALAVTSATRLRALPDLPTIAESGVAGYEVTIWYGVFVPGRTSRNIIAKLNDELNKVVKTKDFVDRVSNDGAEPVGGSPDRFAALIQAEVAKWTRLIRKLDITSAN